MRQKGFTFIELLLVMAVGSVILTGALLSIQQVIVTTGRSNSQVVVLDEVNRAALQIKKDLQSRNSVNISGSSDLLSLEWTNNTSFEGGGPLAYSVNYTLSDNNELLRTCDNTTDITTRIVARQIDSISYSENGTHIDVVITATSSRFPPRSETLSFSVNKRSQET